MKTTPSLLLGLSILSGTAFGQVVVYDNLPSAQYYLINPAPQGGDGNSFGDQVTLAGTERIVTNFELEVTNTSGQPAFTADVSLRFYNVEPGDLVGTQIGSTVTKTGVTINGSTPVEFTGLSITVPDTLIYQVAFDNASITSTYRWAIANPPSVGSSDNTFYYRGSSGAYAFGKTPQVDGAFGNPSVTITATAVPEPSAAMVPFAIVALAFVLHRRIAKRTTY